jgi:hypothetical protein
VTGGKASIKTCIKPPPGIRPDIRVDTHNYQNIEYSILIYNHVLIKIKFLISMHRHGSSKLWKNRMTAAYKLPDIFRFFHET